MQSQLPKNVSKFRTIIWDFFQQQKHACQKQPECGSNRQTTNSGSQLAADFSVFRALILYFAIDTKRCD